MTTFVDPAPLANRVRKNARHLARWARREGLEAYRVYDRDIPEFPYAIDRYGDQLHVQLIEGRRPQEEAAIPDQLEAIAEAMGLPVENLVLKWRRRQRGSSQYEKLDETAPGFEVAEHGLRFEVNLRRYLDTGLFLDHRLTRRMVGDEAEGRDVLNLFAYTGSFSVYAAAGGARRTVTVDMSRTYQDWTRRNLALNGIQAGDEHRLVQGDVLAYLAEARARHERFDIVVLDPPSFSNSKRMSETFDVQRDHAALLKAAMGLLAPGGRLYFSNNRQGFRLDQQVSDTWDSREITARTVPEDFKRRQPHRCWLFSAPASVWG